jgi:hypothetical protein
MVDHGSVGDVVMHRQISMVVNKGRDRLWKRMKKAAYSEKSGTLASD